MSFVGAPLYLYRMVDWKRRVLVDHAFSHTGIHIGSAGAVTSLINEMVLPYFPVSIYILLVLQWMDACVSIHKGEDRMIAYLGIAMKLSSIVGLLITGRFLDWTKAF